MVWLIDSRTHTKLHSYENVLVCVVNEQHKRAKVSADQSYEKKAIIFELAMHKI